MSTDYKKLPKEEFDALVTGELTHYAIWFEDGIVEIISDFFHQIQRRDDFQRLLLRRDGLTFQAKIDIARSLLPKFKNRELASSLKEALSEIESFKSTRNAMAHGKDVTPPGSSEVAVHIEVVGRSGKPRVIVITPESHSQMMDNAERLLKELRLLEKASQQEAFEYLANPFPFLEPP